MAFRHQTNTPTVAAIVPVYNEEKTVGSVVSELLKCELVSEVICVNGGSTDRSLEILKSFGRKIKLVNFKEREGKGQALAAGVERARGDIVLFMDADLIGLSQKHIETILKQIIAKRTDAVLGLPRMKGRVSVPNKRESLLSFFIAHILEVLWEGCVPEKIDAALSGERAYFRNDLLPHLYEMKRARFGVEILLNKIYKNRKVEIVMLYSLANPCKPRKMGLGDALKHYTIESYEVAAEILRLNARELKSRLWKKSGR